MNNQDTQLILNMMTMMLNETVMMMTSYSPGFPPISLITCFAVPLDDT